MGTGAITIAWEISTSAEGWAEIREQLDARDRDALIAAIADDKFEAVSQKADQHHAERAVNAERERQEKLPHDIIVDRAYELIEQNGTCDNGGCAYWIDREGYHKVELVEA